MRVADTSVLYALFDAGDRHHEAARAALADTESILVPAEILAETLGLLRRRSGGEFAATAHRELRSLPNIEVQPTHDDARDNILAATWDAFEEKPNRGYHDSIVIAWCRVRGLKPLTFDKELAKACRGRA